MSSLPTSSGSRRRRLSVSWCLRGALLIAGAYLAAAGLAAFAEGWRLRPLVAYAHARWWGLPSAPLPADLADWQPASADGRSWAQFSQALLADLSSGAYRTSVAVDLARALGATERALMLAPAQPASWARYSLLALNRGDHAMAARALALSFQTAPRYRGLAWLRSRIGLFLWDSLPDAGRASVAHDVRSLWRQAPTNDLPYPQHELVRFAHGLGRLDEVRQALPRAEWPTLERRAAVIAKEAAGAS